MKKLLLVLILVQVVLLGCSESPVRPLSPDADPICRTKNGLRSERHCYQSKQFTIQEKQ